MDLIARFKRLKLSRTTPRGCKFLLPPDQKDYRWGIDSCGGCRPITQAAAEKLISKMELWQGVKAGEAADLGE